MSEFLIANADSVWISGAVFILGLIFGSFFNVCIYRLPLELSVAKGRSFCPSCQGLIPWFANIPVASYLALRGKCRTCEAKISLQYPLVELTTGLLFVLLWRFFGPSWHFISYVTFCSALLVITIIDLHHRIIPDEISLSGIVVGFLFVFPTGDISWSDSLLGILLGGGVFLLIAWTYEKMTKQEGLGGGDIKLLAMIGAWLGYQSLLTVILVSSCVGSVVGILTMLIQKKDMKTAIPFGPFLALGALVYLFLGDIVSAVLLPVR